MLGIERVVERYGGVVRTSELARHGYDGEMLKLFVRCGLIYRVRQGWWCRPSASAGLLVAWRARGRLACVSALEHHQSLPISAANIHIALDRSAGRPPDETIVAHWSRRELAGDRRAVSVEVALEQARVCRAAATLPREAGLLRDAVEPLRAGTL